MSAPPLTRSGGILYIVSGPSGSGKTTLCRRLSREDSNVFYSISCTTRLPREGEVDGRDYHFLSDAEFEKKIEAGEFLEHAKVHGRHYYGTLRSVVDEHLDVGEDVVMDLDVQGAELVRNSADDKLRESLVDIFVLLGSSEDVRIRLGARGTENEEEVTRRIQTAMEEMTHWQRYRYAMVSGTMEEDAARFQALIEAERCRAKRLTAPTFI